jgi:hypothetical protein
MWLRVLLPRAVCHPDLLTPFFLFSYPMWGICRPIGKYEVGTVQLLETCQSQVIYGKGLLMCECSFFRLLH